MRKFFYPDSVVVVGVSPVLYNLGRNMVENLRSFNYPGRIYAVGREAGSVSGVEIYPSIASLPEAADLAAILTPAQTIPAVIRDCGQKGIKRAVILSGGFAERGDERLPLQQELLEAAREYGVRFIGPNTMGLVCPASGLAVPFASLPRESVTVGSLTILTQSGSVGFLAAWNASIGGVGLAKYVSIGNKLNTDEVDLLPYFMYEDEQTKTICLYLEGMNRGREFVELARKSPKPVVVLKANISEATEHAAKSHTASLASDDRVVEGALRQAGITRVKAVRDFVTAAKALSLPPLSGDNLGVVVSTGGSSVLSADFSYRYGFHLPPLPEALLRELDGYARAKVISLGNPIDMGDIYDNNAVLLALEKVLALPEIHGVVASPFHHIGTPFPGPQTPELIELIGDLVQRYQKPVALSFMATPQQVQMLRDNTKFPIFNDAEESLAALAMLREYSRYRAKPITLATPWPVDKAAAASLIANARHDGLKDIGPAAMPLLAAYGIPTAPLHFASSADEAIALADQLGYPLALKAVAPNLSHKSDVGGVCLNLHSPDAVRQAYQQMRATLHARLPHTPLSGVVLQRMVPGGHELILGAKHDTHFGPVVMFGLGGIFTEVFADVSFRLAPLSRQEAEDMLWEVKGARLLQGVRGQPAADVNTLVVALQQLGQLIADREEIAEIDINPLKVFAGGEGAIAVDARVVLR